jgi:hypothetical protein
VNAQQESERDELPQLSWEQAEVHDRELHVALTAQAPRGWAGRFRELLARLGQDGEHRWGRISVSRREVKVADVEEAGAGDLRHLLESVLLQVNTDFAPDEGDGQAGEASPEGERDARLTEAFRGFAGDG